MELYQLKKEEVLATLFSKEDGLSRAEAEERLKRYGKNALKGKKKKSRLALFFSQFKDLMTLILIAAAFLSGVLAFLTKDVSELTDTGILLFIILLNAVVGFLQEYRADAALEALKTLTVSEANVLRDGAIVRIPSEELVPGDVVELEEGDRIPADGRILSSEELYTDESALTGESKPVRKCDCILSRTPLSQRANTVFYSTFCVRGRGRFVVTACGMQTEMGRIADLIGEAKEVPSPLDKIIVRLGKIITATVLAVAAVLFLGGLLASRVSLLKNLMNAVAVAVAAIPEGMGAVVTVILAMGVQRLSKSRAVIRKLSAVETLGGCTYICSDKTGTLTQNKMTVEEVKTAFPATMSEEYSATRAQKEFLTCIRVCHTVKDMVGTYAGDPTEIALLEYADRIGFTLEGRGTPYLPFSSERKKMAVRFQGRLYWKGGAEVLLKKCRFIADEGGERPLTEKILSAIQGEIKRFSGRAMRVIAFAYSPEGEEEALTFLGLAALFDPPKEGARDAVMKLKKAGVRTVMITGDSAETAFAVALRLGIASRPEEVITGEEIDGMGEEEYARRVYDYTVYARVLPGHKSEIVRALQKKGEVVAMTGDGVNDAPALKAADIGVAMGSGTDVTKNAAEIVLQDDDFSTLVRAVEEGRNVFCTIKKTVAFFLATNFAEVLSVLLVTLFLFEFRFLTSTQLLWVNLITDSLPVLALGLERTPDVMQRPPVSEREIFSKSSLGSMVFFGMMQTALVVAIFLLSLALWGNDVATTTSFLTLSFLELFHAFNVRKEAGCSRFKELISNKVLLLTVFVGVAVNVLLVLAAPFRFAFSLTSLTGGQWACVALFSLIILPIGELYKMAFKRRRNDTRSRESRRLSAATPRQ